MVGEGWDWYMGYEMVTTRCFSVMSGVKVGLALVHLSYQDWVTLDWFGQFTSAQPFQCLTISIMNGVASLRLEFIIHNHHHTSAFESWVVTNSCSSTLRFTPRWSMFGLIQEFHSIWTISMSLHKYNEWLEKVEVGICALWWSPQGVFQSGVGAKLSCLYSTTCHTKIE